MSGEESFYEDDELAAIDGWRLAVVEGGTRPAVSGLRRRSAGGTVVGAAMLGLREVLEPRRDQPPIVVEAPGKPDDPAASVTLHFDPDRPDATVAFVPWR